MKHLYAHRAIVLWRSLPCSHWRARCCMFHAHWQGSAWGAAIGGSGVRATSCE